MKKHLILLLTLLSLNLYSQSKLYMPIEFQRAYKGNTRSFDGSPGQNYWQNFSSYNISAEIKPGDWKIIGNQKITYTNNSPDSLSVLIIKTYPNHYKKGSARANAVPEETVTEGMEITDFTINNKPINLDKNPFVSIKSTFIKISLENPILPNSSVFLTMSWTTEMPLIYVNRIGAYDKSSAFIGYWYPQIASYSDIDGWDEMEYMASQEFNTDFANYEVVLKAPENFNIWATGELQNPKEVLSDKVLQNYNKAKTSKDYVVVNRDKVDNLTRNQKTWLFNAFNINDFAFGVSDNFRWISNAITIGDKKVSSNLVYDKSHYNSVEQLLSIQGKGIKYLSNIYPGIDFPFPKFTTFVGIPEFDGMEFPMMANNGVSNKEVENTDVTFHELAHTYFPFLMGINEVKYSWMEEGWAIFLTIKFIQHYYKGTSDENAELKRNLDSYNLFGGSMWDLPLITPTYLLNYKPAHTQLAYRKPAFMYLTLENLLGEDIFKKCLITYINSWKGKHPTPYDFMFTFNEVSNRNLDWFWEAWVFELGYGDLGILNIGNSKVYIQNIGGLPLPISLRLNYKNGNYKIINETASIWNEVNSDIVGIDIVNSNDLLNIELITDSFPDVDKKNNLLEIKP